MGVLEFRVWGVGGFRVLVLGLFLFLFCVAFFGAWGFGV